MKNINISLIDQIIYSSSPFLLFLILSANTEFTTFAVLSSTYTINVLFNSSYQAYLVEPLVTHWNYLDEKNQNQLLVSNLKTSIRESYVIQIFSLVYSALILSILLDSVGEIVLYLILLWLSGISTSTLLLSRRIMYLTNFKQKSVYLSLSHLLLSLLFIYFFIDNINTFPGFFYFLISIAALASTFIISKKQFNFLIKSFSPEFRGLIKKYRFFDLLTVPSGWILANLYLSLGIINLSSIEIAQLKTYFMISSIGLAIHPVLHNVYVVKINQINKTLLKDYFSKVIYFISIYFLIFWFFQNQIYNLLFPFYDFDSSSYLLILLYTVSGIFWLCISTIFRALKMGMEIFIIYLIGAVLLVCLFVFNPATNIYNAILQHTYSSALSLAASLYCLYRVYEK
ncbi:MAG: hypothetical protein CMD13_03985 [Flavobacteriales bacterium]|nr:hypothetical protein [Flavobacteriales bacterium]